MFILELLNAMLHYLLLTYILTTSIAPFSSFLHFCCLNAEKYYFNQQTGCEAPIYWSKHTTIFCGVFLIGILLFAWGH